MRKKLAILAGIGCLAFVASACTLSEHEVSTRYHLSKLREDPKYLLKLIIDGDAMDKGSPAAAAIREFMKSMEGVKAMNAALSSREFGQYMDKRGMGIRSGKDQRETPPADDAEGVPGERERSG